jgi:hypothetical protein
MFIKIFLSLSFLFAYSCGYPDIDSVPSFQELTLTEDELFDLCELSSADKSDIHNCIIKKKNK